jgi:SAM-dependent methyltransferase
MNTKYTRDFYRIVQAGSERSAAEIVPLVLSLTGATSVVDVGCGDGQWLKTFKANGISDLLGVDGPWVDPSAFTPGQFVSADLARPLELDRRFDLAVCLEVAEHLIADSAPTLVASLARMAPVVMFSAAIPRQGGIDHLNEQWPEYWARLFDQHGFRPVDAIRPRVWNSAVETWYAQNTIIYVDRDHLSRCPELEAAAARTDPAQLSVVHPRHYLSSIVAAEGLASRPDPNRLSLSTVLSIIPALARNAVHNRLRKR